MTSYWYAAGLAIVASVAWAVAAPLLRGAIVPPSPSGDPERYRLEKERDLAYAAIKEAEFDLQMGKLSDEDYATLRRTYEDRALAALAALDRR
ncbi:MAG TPA: hypothetical protein VGK30_04460 [Candidatus Binatia bacterium]